MSHPIQSTLPSAKIAKVESIPNLLGTSFSATMVSEEVARVAEILNGVLTALEACQPLDLERIREEIQKAVSFNANVMSLVQNLGSDDNLDFFPTSAVCSFDATKSMKQGRSVGHMELPTEAVKDAQVGEWLTTTFSEGKKKREAQQERVLKNFGGGKGTLGGAASPRGSMGAGSRSQQSAPPEAPQEPPPDPNVTGTFPVITDVSSNEPLSPGAPVQEGEISSASVPEGLVKKTTNLYYRTDVQQDSDLRVVSSEEYTALLEMYNTPYLDVDSADFDIFAEMERHGTDDIFTHVCLNVLFRYSFLKNLDLNATKLVNFIRAVQSAYYRENPYHNMYHAADVLQTTHIYLCQNEARANFDDAELLSVLIAALVHDVAHLGVGNPFLIKTQHPLAQLYNDTSPLESMHAALTFLLLKRPDNNFFDGSTIWNDSYNESFRARVVEIVVGTDMKYHASMINTVAEILADGIIVDEEVPQLLRCIVHAADLSNVMKPFHVYLQWANRVTAESWRQGDVERSRGMPVSVMCDRYKPESVARSQVGFISVIVKPFIQELSMLLPEVWMERLEFNFQYMNELVTSGERIPVEPIEKLAEGEWKDQWVHSNLMKLLKPDDGSARRAEFSLMQESPDGISRRGDFKHASELFARIVTDFNEEVLHLRRDPIITRLSLREHGTHLALTVMKTLIDFERTTSSRYVSGAFPELFSPTKVGSLSPRSSRSSQHSLASQCSESARRSPRGLTKHTSLQIRSTAPTLDITLPQADQLRAAGEFFDELLEGEETASFFGDSHPPGGSRPPTELNPLRKAVASIFQSWNGMLANTSVDSPQVSPPKHPAKLNPVSPPSRETSRSGGPRLNPYFPRNTQSSMDIRPAYEVLSAGSGAAQSRVLRMPYSLGFRRPAF